jgi:hypothetical protein
MGYDDLVTKILTGVDTPYFNLTTEGPLENYRAYAETMNRGLQKLINNDVYLKKAIFTGRIYLDLINGYAMSTAWSNDPSAWGGATYPMFSQVSSNNSNPLLFDITQLLPLGKPFTVTGFGMYIQGKSHTEIPYVLPNIGLGYVPQFATSRSAETVVELYASIFDTSADLATYETLHAVSATGLGTQLTRGGTTDDTYLRYYIRILGEKNYLTPNPQGVMDVCAVYIDIA